MNTSSTFENEVRTGKRFEFGKNWQSFLSTLTSQRIEGAERSLVEMMGVASLENKSFLDIGSGSGLFSLAARRIGAEVCSFDYDPASVDCTKTLRARYFPDDPNWVICEGSALDEEFLESLGKFDVVYSWGVLHHTGDMWTALENAAAVVRKDGTLFVAIYNDQGIKSKLWRKTKEVYCTGKPGRFVVSLVFYPYFFFRALISSILNRKNVFRRYKENRGMSITHDWSDWLGGLPFEVAKVEEIFHFARERGFALKNLTTTNNLGTNQFVFQRNSD